MPLIVKTYYHRSERHRQAGLLEINLLPPTRAQFARRWCKDVLSNSYRNNRTRSRQD